MRDIFDEIYDKQVLDPRESARRGLRRTARPRFYAQAAAGEGEGGFPVLLDGRPVRTPARRVLAAPSRPLAAALAAEWEAQQEVVDPARMPLTRLVNAIIDGVVDAPGAVAAEIGNYLGTDLLFYRAGEPAGLVDAQARHWDPVLAWARTALGARFVLAEGVMHVAQPEGALASARAAIPADPWRLGALSAITTLTGSALLALALLRGALTADQAWAAAHVDEDWQMAFWGSDEVALQRRGFREAEMRAAAEVLRLLG
jgi:chaperone required for assembly of F1-ATPase